jgi:creatinine amidohydrolase/Fe(II)-dependent formamide hydrolase-like protein
MIASFRDLNPEGFAALRPDLTVFLFPVGGIEQHGPHLPLGTKIFQAEALASGIARELEKRLPAWNFIVMPVIPLTIDGITRNLCTPVRPHVVRDAIVDQCEHLKRLGHKNFIAVNSHLSPKQVTALEEAAKIVTGRAWFAGSGAKLISITSALVDSSDVFLSPMIALPAEHGGASDTSSMLHLAPHLVKPGYESLGGVPKPKPTVARFLDYVFHRIDGRWGDPSIASALSGRIDLDATAGLLAEKAVPWLQKGAGASQFRSPYRHFPFNWSFAKAYVLLFFLFLMGLVWLFWSVQDVFSV